MITLCSVLDRQKVIHTWPFSLSVGNGGFYGSVKHYFGYNHLQRSFLSSPEEEAKFRFLLRRIERPKCAIEIGTYKGTGTALLAQYADKVVTIDTKNYVDKYAFWIEYGVCKRIESYLIENEEDKAELLSRFDFDFAFIDGNHTENGVRSDFELTKKCGRVLFHDYYEANSDFDKGMANTQGVVPVVNSLPNSELLISKPFAYWEEDGYD